MGRLFVNALTSDGKHYLLNTDNWTQPIQMQLSQKQKTFSHFFLFLFFAFLKPVLKSSSTFSKRKSLKPDVFLKLRAPKIVIREMSKKSCFRRPFDRQHKNGLKHCCNLDGSTFTIFINHSEGNCVAKSLF